MSLWHLWLSQTLITPQMSTAQRHERLGPLFEPRPGTRLEMSRKVLADRTKDPLFLKGEIWVKPPKGSCLRIRSDFDKPDQKICRPQTISWNIHEIDPAGRIQRLVIAGNPDEGTLLTWNTPYRMANFVAFGKMEKGEDEDVPVWSCEAQEVEDPVNPKLAKERSIILTLFNGRRWRIDLPEVDTALPPPKVKKPEPVQDAPQAETKEEPKAEAKEEPKADPKNTEAAPSPETPREKSRLEKLLSGESVEEEKIAYYFRVTGQEVFEMPSTFFREGDSPGGLKGKCRYKFKGASYDKDSGVIECYDTSSMDAVYVHVPCMSQLSSRPVFPPPEKEEQVKPKAPEKKEEQKAPH
jgi:hypothetical protein